MLNRSEPQHDVGAVTVAKPAGDRQASQTRLEAAMEEVLDAIAAGVTLDRAALLAKYNDVAEELSDCLINLDFIQNVAPQLADDAVAQSADELSAISGRATLGDFRILCELGRGGMGVVYEAEQMSLGRRMALKVLPFAGMLDKQQLQRFKNEARAAATLDHPNIVAVHSVGQERSVHFYAMQLVDGQSLAQWITGLRTSRGVRAHAEGGTAQSTIELGTPFGIPQSENNLNTTNRSSSHGMGPEEIQCDETRRGLQAAISTIPAFDSREYHRTVARLGIQAARALDYAHQNGIVHRDVKPGNLLVDADGKLLVTDFGLARLESDAGLTFTGDVLGTPRYMSPEQVLGQRAVVDHRSDIYSLGATMYELLTLTPAVPGRDREQVLNHLASSEPRPPQRINPKIPLDLSTIVLKALSRSPAERYETAAAMADDLQRFLHDEPIRARPPSFSQRLTRRAIRHKVVVAALGTFLLFSTLTLGTSTYLILRARTAAVNTSHELQEALDAKQAAFDQMNAALKEKNSALLREVQTALAVYPMNIASADELLKHGNYKLARSLLDLYADGTELSDRRGFEWHYLWGLANSTGDKTLYGHEESVFSVAFSPDSLLLASAGGDRTIRLWDTRTGEPLRVLSGHSSDVNGIAFSPDGDTLASASEDHTIGLWQCATGERKGTLHGHADMVNCITYSPDGRLLASGGVDGELRIWDGRDGRELATVQAHDGRIHSVSVSSDSEKLATSSADQSVKVWSLSSFQCIGTFQKPEDTLLQSVVFKPGAEEVVTCCRTGQIRIWNIPRAELVREIMTDSNLLGVATCTANQLGTIGGQGCPLTIWRNSFCRAVYPLSDTEVSWCLAFSPDERLAAVGSDHQVILYDMRRPPTFQTLMTSRRGITCLAITPETQRVVVGPAGGALHMRDIRTGTQLGHNIGGFPRTVPCIAYSPDGSLLAIAGRDGTVSIRDASSEVEIKVLTVLPGAVSAVAFSVDGHLFAASSRSHVKVWETGSWCPASDFPLGRFRDVSCLQFLSGGRLLFGSDRFGWVLPNGPQSGSLYLHGIGALDVSKDGTLTAAGFRDGHVELYHDLNTLTSGPVGSRQFYVGSHAGPVLAVSLSHDGKTMATAAADGTLYLWDVQSGTRMLQYDLRTLKELPGLKSIEKISLEFAHDGSVLIAAVTCAGALDPVEPRGAIFAWYGHRRESTSP